MNDDKLIKVTTESGFECTVSKDDFDDWELTKIIADGVDDTLGSLRLFRFVKEHVLSPEDSARLEEYATRDGRVRSSIILAEIQDIMNAVNTSKNSESSQKQ